MATAHTLAQKHGNALRSGNAGVTVALKPSQLRCRKSWQHQDFRSHFPSLPSIFFHWFKGFQLGYTMERIPPWSGWLASF